MAYFQKLKQNGWTKKFATTRNLFLGHFYTRKAFDQILLSVMTHMACGNKRKRGRFSKTVFSRALQCPAKYFNKRMSTNVTFYALSSAVTGIDVRSKVREIQLETWIQGRCCNNFDRYCTFKWKYVKLYANLDLQTLQRWQQQASNPGLVH